MSDLSSYFSLADEREHPETLRADVAQGAEFRGGNLWVLIFAILIASVGLNVNSTAVIIGAMLISPLMGPILSMGFGLATYDFNLLGRAVKNFAFAVGVSLAASTLYFSFTPLREAHSELLARTSPNIYDVIIAFVGGLAGVIALSSKRKGNAIPGAAIATALMPPLCTAGYGLATGNLSFFFGAVYLFTINVVFIGVAALVTVRFLLRVPVSQKPDERHRRMANRAISYVVLATLLPSVYFGYVLVGQERFAQRANLFIQQAAHFEGDYLLKTEVDPVRRSIRLVYGGRPLVQVQKDSLAVRAARYGLADARLVCQQGFASDMPQTSAGQEELPAKVLALQQQLARLELRLDSLQPRTAPSANTATKQASTPVE